ncbi:hypothetical protein [Prosthecobacter sp.]|uniref:hypothetical protein n=1 Tax=Prosthecobacter sp. TaxID=1965333 RepID=UPI0037851EB6
MCNIYRTTDGKVWKASQKVDLSRADGSKVEGVWGGSAKQEKLDWWLKKPGHELTQTAEVAAVGVKDNKTEDVAWGDAPEGAHLLFVLEAPVVGKNGAPYRIAKMVTREATEGEASYFQEPRCSLFGTMTADRGIRRLSPLPAPPPKPSAQSELF